MKYNSKDIQPEIGPKTRHVSIEACLEEVRKKYPRAYMEGSCGVERSFWVDRKLVAYSWNIRGTKEQMWLRISEVPLDA